MRSADLFLFLHTNEVIKGDDVATTGDAQQRLESVEETVLRLQDEMQDTGWIMKLLSWGNYQGSVGHY